MKNKQVKSKTRTLKKVLFAVFVPLLTAAVGATALAGAILGGGNRRMPLNSADNSSSVSSTTINLGTDAINTSDKAAVQQLMNYVAGSSSNVTYNNLANGITSPKTADKFTAKTVTMGGIVWNVMYVSTADNTANGTTAGDVIVTLWQASSNGSYMSAFANSASSTRSLKYPSAMYGASVVRGTLVGSSTVGNSAGTGLTTVAQNSHWAPFTSGVFSSLIATPANMNWQKTQGSPLALRVASATNKHYPWNFPNDAWGNLNVSLYTTTDNDTTRTTPGGAWYGTAGTDNCNYGDNETGSFSENNVYSAWKNDKLWLPSMTETGWQDSNFINEYGTAGSGLWNASSTQRATGVSSGNGSSAWLRSGGNYDAPYAYYLPSSGSNTTPTIVRHLSLFVPRFI